MLNTRELRVRVTLQQLSHIKLQAQLQGYHSVSAYVRDKILRIPYQAEQRLIEIHRIIMER